MAIDQTQVPHISPDQKPSRTVGLISDTHVPTRAKAVPPEVFRIFENVDFIIHAGDLVDLSVIDDLEQIAPVLAVRGNMDSPKIREVLPELASLKVMNWKIGVIHDPGRINAENKLQDVARQNLFNVLVYGHTHASSLRWENQTLYINPGSPTAPEPPFLARSSVGLLKLTIETVAPEIIQI